MKIAIVALLCMPAVVLAQSAPQIRDISPPNAVSSLTFANIFTVREVAGGNVLVNDAVRRQLVLLDAALSHGTVALDSLSDAAHNYGPIPEPLLRWLGDSSIILDPASRTMLVLNEAGHFVRAMAPPRQSDLQWLYDNESDLDSHGNLLYRASSYHIDSVPLAGGRMAQRVRPADSAAIVRAVFDTRSADTLARIKQDNSSVTEWGALPNGRATLHIIYNPLTPIDEWTVLSDGTLAFVRGHDYHVDWLLPDGTWKSTAKLPFDWKPLADHDKQALIDSVRARIERARSEAEATGDRTAGEYAVRSYLKGALATNTRPVSPPVPSATSAPLPPVLTYDFAPLNEIADYYPPIRVGGAKADFDGNLWILPTTSAQSKRGELVYDVINPRSSAFFRVRMPVGRSIAGFGRNGTIYLMNRDASGWHLERTRVAQSMTSN